MAKEKTEYLFEFYDPPKPLGQPTILVAVPFYAYKIFAPPIMDRQLNMFQKAILGLSQVGSYTPDEMAAYLHLDRDLILLILAELTTMRLIQGDGRLTARGTKALKSEEWDDLQNTDNFTIGYIYQDPNSSQFLPRFNPKRQFPELQETHGGSKQRMVGGTKGSPTEEVIVTLSSQFDDYEPKSPTPKLIFDILKRHRIALLHGGAELSASKSLGKVPTDMQKISVLQPDPDRVYLLTWIYLPLIADAPDDWRVADPFCLGENSVMKAILQAYLPKDTSFSRALDKLLRPQEDRLHQDYGAAKQYLRMKAEEGMLEQIGLLKISPILEKAVLEFEYQYQEGKAGKPSTLLPIEAQKVLEQIMNEIADWDTEIFRSLSRTLPRPMFREDLSELLKSSAARFRISDLPFVLTTVARDKITAWPRERRISLRPMVVATLLATANDANHPFTKLLVAEPRGLQIFANVSSFRDTHAHGASSGGVTSEDAKSLNDDIYLILIAYLKSIQE